MTQRRRPEPSERAFRSVVSALWPDYGDTDPRQYDLDKAYAEITSRRRLDLTGPGPKSWEPWPAPVTRPLLRITCDLDRHGAGGLAPTRAEIWRTTPGLLFAARLAGAFTDPDPDPAHPLSPPVPVLPREMRTSGHRAAPLPPHVFQPIPVTIVRVLLDRPPLPTLWTKCSDHGTAIVDPDRLNVAYGHAARRFADTPAPVVVPLHDVRALSSD